MKKFKRKFHKVSEVKHLNNLKQKKSNESSIVVASELLWWSKILDKSSRVRWSGGLSCKKELEKVIALYTLKILTEKKE